MQIRILTHRAGMNFEQHEGDVIDMPDVEARKLIRAGQAEPVNASRKEAAMVGGGRENAMASPVIQARK